MDNLNKINLYLPRLTRTIFVADCVLTLALVAVVVLPNVFPAQAGLQGADDPSVKADVAVDAKLSREEIARLTTGRAPFRVSGTAREKVVNELSHFELKGVSVRAGKRCAYVRDTKLKRLLVKQAGDSLGPYEIVEVGDTGITLRRGNETLVLSKG